MIEAKELKTVPIFSELSEARLEKLFSKFRKTKVKRNTMVIQQGEAGRELFILAEGKIKIFLSYPDGREVTLTTLQPRDHFGELSLLDNLPRSASARTLETSLLYTLDKDSFNEFLDENPEAIAAILAAMSRMVRRLTDQVHSLSFQDVRGRVARKIFEMAQSEMTAVTHQELADMVGAARETVTRAINFFEEKKIIQMDRKGILLLAPDELAKLF